MKLPLNFDQLEGKTILGTIFVDGYTSDSVTIAFTDGTYTNIRCVAGYDGENSLEIEALEWDGIIAAGVSRYIELGVVTKEEAWAESERRDSLLASNRCLQELGERALYEKLKRKFEGES
jgi:hypothetical protein